MQITIANLSEAQNNKRLDSQFFKPEYVFSSNIVNCSEYSVLSDISRITDGNHLKIAEDFDAKSGIRYLRGQDLNPDMMLHDRNVIYISEHSFDNLKRSHIFKNDILVTIVGANTGLVGLVFNPPEKLVANCKLGIIRPDNREISSHFLYAFLIGRFGQHQILRLIRGGGQTGLVLPDMSQLKIARLSNYFEKYIDRLVFKGHRGHELSKKIYQTAQDILLNELGLKDWQPKHELCFIKNYSDTVEAERMDAEYFQPKYDDIVNAIKSYKGGWDELCNLCELIGHPSNPPYADNDGEDKTFIVTQKHLGDFTLNDEFWNDKEALYTNDQFINKNYMFMLKKEDVLLYSVGAYIGKANIYTEDVQATIGSFLTLIRAKQDKLNPYYLMTLLNMDIGIAISKRHQRGMAQQYLYPYDTRTFPIPLISREIQLEIQQKVQESIKLRKQSNQLLENAKTAVEMAIEQDEETAMNWLENQHKFKSQGH